MLSGMQHVERPVQGCFVDENCTHRSGKEGMITMPGHLDAGSPLNCVDELLMCGVRERGPCLGPLVLLREISG